MQCWTEQAVGPEGRLTERALAYWPLVLVDKRNTYYRSNNCTFLMDWLLNGTEVKYGHFPSSFKIFDALVFFVNSVSEFLSRKVEVLIRVLQTLSQFVKLYKIRKIIGSWLNTVLWFTEKVIIFNRYLRFQKTLVFSIHGSTGAENHRDLTTHVLIFSHRSSIFHWSKPTAVLRLIRPPLH